MTALTGDKAVASIELITHLQTLVSELMADVTDSRQIDSWQSRLRNMYQVVTVSVVCKRSA